MKRRLHMKFPWEPKTVEDHRYEILVYIRARGDVEVITIDSMAGFDHVYAKVGGRSIDACVGRFSSTVRGALPVHDRPEVELILKLIRDRVRYAQPEVIGHRDVLPAPSPRWFDFRGDCLDELLPALPKAKPAQHRLDQARALIRIRMTMTVDEVEVYAPSYIRTPDAEARDQGYTSVMKLRDDKESARAALRTEIARVVSALERARDVATVLGLREEFEAMIQTVTKVQERVTA